MSASETPQTLSDAVQSAASKVGVSGNGPVQPNSHSPYPTLLPPTVAYSRLPLLCWGMGIWAAALASGWLIACLRGDAKPLLAASLGPVIMAIVLFPITIVVGAVVSALVYTGLRSPQRWGYCVFGYLLGAAAWVGLVWLWGEVMSMGFGLGL
jgi:hypothetical protein